MNEAPVYLLKGPKRGRCKTCRGAGTTRYVQNDNTNKPPTHLLCETHAAATAEQLRTQGITVHRRWSGF